MKIKLAISNVGIELIKYYEGLSLEVYLDPIGIKTVGWGHVCDSLNVGQTITLEQAEEFLLSDLKSSEDIINSCVKINLNQNEFDALVSFVYNIGPGETGVKDGLVHLTNGEPSTLLRDLNAKKITQAGDQFLLWDRAGGEVLAGLQHRRQVERKLFLYNVLNFMV